MIGMFLLGVFAGWCNENTSGGGILIVILMLLYCKIFCKKIRNWMVSGLVGSIIGFLFMTLSPGNSVRSEYALSTENNRHVFAILIENVDGLTNILQGSFAPLIIIFIVSITIVINQKNWKRIYISFMYFTASIATVYAMALSPFIPGRAMFGATIFLIIACGHALSGISLKENSHKIFFTCFIAVIAFQFSTSFINGLYDIMKTKIRYNERQRYINSQIAEGNINIIVTRISLPQTKHNPMWGLRDFNTDPTH